MTTPKATDYAIALTADLQKWRAFVAIGELGSLTRAALFLDSNQSLLSRQLNALERECGARLFNRTGRGVELSEVGLRLFPQVKALLSDAQQLEREILGEALEPTGRVTLGLLPSIAQPLSASNAGRNASTSPWAAPPLRILSFFIRSLDLDHWTLAPDFSTTFAHLSMSPWR